MASSSTNITCQSCNKADDIYICVKCDHAFCFRHLQGHRQELHKRTKSVQDQLESIEHTLNYWKKYPEDHPLMKIIAKWEHKSINRIHQTAQTSREEIRQFLKQHIYAMNDRVKYFATKLAAQTEEEGLDDSCVSEWKTELSQLEKTIEQPPNIIISEDSTTLVKILRSSIGGFLRQGAKWDQNGITVAGGNGVGAGRHQLNYPTSIYVDQSGTIYVSDCKNRRIVEWKHGDTSGNVITTGSGKENQLGNPIDFIMDEKDSSFLICDNEKRCVVRWPRGSSVTKGEIVIEDISCSGLALDNEGSLYVTDIDKHEVRRYRKGENIGAVVAGGNGKGSDLDQLNKPYFVRVDSEHSVYVSDAENHRVVKWRKGDKKGVVVAGGNGCGAQLTQLNNPEGLLIENSGTLFIADSKNNRVMRWFEGAQSGDVVVGGPGRGNGAHQLIRPIGLSFDTHGNLYVVDFGNNRIQRFNLQQP